MRKKTTCHSRAAVCERRLWRAIDIRTNQSGPIDGTEQSVAERPNGA